MNLMQSISSFKALTLQPKGGQRADCIACHQLNACGVHARYEPIAKKKSPTQRTLEKLRRDGFIAHVVEKWVPQAGRRVDAFGFGDVLAASPSAAVILLVQATSGAHVQDRKRKILAEPKARTWLESGGRIEVWGWRPLKVKRGGKAIRYEAKIEAVTMEEFDVEG
ncbi:MAG: hypothetical protein GWO44_01325 [Thermoplasmata archaeon]|nr:hypothetical protein [Thermoplasmata archaeon]NIY01934.1 hypothetical protein [Thermoplasmata archaeon]